MLLCLVIAGIAAAESVGDATAERRLVERVNELRAGQGVAPLRVDDALTRIARAHSCRMMREGFFSHTAPSGDDVGDRVQAAGKPYRAVGENIARNVNACDPVDRALEGWMKSEGHRENLLTDRFTETGAGVCRNGRDYYFTQVFLRRR